MKDNGVRFYEKNLPIVEAVASGEIELGLVNHYYLYLAREEQPDAPVANHFLPGDDPGAFVSTAGVGMLAGTDSREAAERFVEFLLSDDGQRFYTETAEEAEYPLVAGIPVKEGLPPLDSLGGPKVDYSSLGDELENTLELLNETGYTS
jgi:iron(III) transport system substrate-binding protein